MTVKKTQQNLSSTLENTEQALGGIENALNNNVGGRLLAIAGNSKANDGLPEGWVVPRMGDLAPIITKGTTPTTAGFQYTESGIPFIKVENIGKNGIELSSVHQYISDEAHMSLKRSQFEVDDVLFSIAGTIGKTALVSLADLPANTNQAVAIIRGVSDFFEPKFLRLQLTEASSRIAKEKARGGGMNNVSLGDLKSLDVLLPPLAEQTVIAQTLDTLLAQVDSIKARLDAIPKILKTFRQSVLAAAVNGKLTEEWRGENGIDHETWCFKEAQEVCDSVQSGSTPRDNPFDQGGKVPFLKVYNIVNQKINFDYKAQFVTEEIHNSKLKRSIAKPNDVLMNIVGPPLGKVAILTDQYPEWNLNQAITLFRVDEEKYLAKLLYYVLCEGELVRKVMPDTKGSVGQINISLTQCRKAIIPLPLLEEQTQIVRRIEELFTFADKIEQQVKNAQKRVNTLTQSILAKAFRGELTAQWRAENHELISGDNSAKALLAKIKEEHEKFKLKKLTKKKAI